MNKEQHIKNADKLLSLNLETPCFVVEKNLLENNLRILHEVKEKSSAKVLLALKSFAMWHYADLINNYLDGICASGLWEAKLGREYFKEVHTFSAAYSQSDIKEILSLSDHVIFNSHNQQQRFLNEINSAKQKKALQIGLRINPEQSEGKVEIYDPSAKGSRLGITKNEFKPDLLTDIDGLHFHNLCEQNFAELDRTLNAFENKFSKYIKQMKWINFGGGHHITVADYEREKLIERIINFRKKYDLEVILEPGEAVAINCGYYVTEVLDIVKNNDISIAIIDGSCCTHMPDVLEMPYRPLIINSFMPNEAKYNYRIGGLSCLAGDVVADYSFNDKLNIGDKLIFTDMAHYTMVKTNTFNGVKLANIYAWDSIKNELELVKAFDYLDFKNRLS